MNPHVDVGAYLLGALDDAEMTRFEAHLTECDECGAHLDELMGVVPVLAELRADGVADVEPPGDALLGRLLDQVSAERRGRRRRRLVAVAVAAVLVVGGPLVGLLGTGGGHGTPAAVATFAADQHTASNPATGASAVVGVSDRAWGSAVDLRLSGVHGPLRCRLDAVTAAGTRQTLASWSVPYAGYGTAAHATPLTVHGTTALRTGEISRFEVRASDDSLLVSVPNTEPADRPRGSAG